MNEKNEIKEKIYTAVRCMDNKSASELWNIIENNFEDFAKWASIPEEEPDEFDLYMLEQIKNNPDCKEFISSEELKKELGLNENEYQIA